MNRIIKFRVWDKKHQFFTRPDSFGYLAYTIRMDGRISASTPAQTYPVDNDNLEAQFYTGLKDKNDKEIYEGDFIKVEFDASCMMLGDVEIMALPGRYSKRKSKINLVEWSGLGFNHFSTVYTIGAMGHETLEVVGNIFENPELLK